MRSLLCGRKRAVVLDTEFTRAAEKRVKEKEPENAQVVETQRALDMNAYLMKKIQEGQVELMELLR